MGFSMKSRQVDTVPVASADISMSMRADYALEKAPDLPSMRRPPQVHALRAFASIFCCRYLIRSINRRHFQ